MKPSKGIWTCIGLLAAFAVNAAAPAQPYIGVPEVVLPKGMPSAAVVLFSGAAGWGEVERALAGSLAERGQMVMGVDLAATLRRMRTSSDTCITLIGEIEAVSHQVQREAGARSYHFPVLAGIGAGGTVALAVAAQAAIATI
ncbi:MAG: type IV secretory pathway protein AcvB, partial [Betaproteobacteria bacterium HGW-Betaproteobacteria-21]